MSACLSVCLSVSLFAVLCPLSFKLVFASTLTMKCCLSQLSAVFMRLTRRTALSFGCMHARHLRCKYYSTCSGFSLLFIPPLLISWSVFLVFPVFLNIWSLSSLFLSFPFSCSGSLCCTLRRMKRAYLFEPTSAAMAVVRVMCHCVMCTLCFSSLYLMLRVVFNQPSTFLWY